MEKHPDFQPLLCGFCDAPLDHLLLSEREDHYLAHTYQLDKDDSMRNTGGDGSLAVFKAVSNTGAAADTSAEYMRHIDFKPARTSENVFWYPSLNSSPPGNFTPGLIPVLKSALTKLCARGITKRAVLCSPGVCHIKTEFFDIGWGCGYRNFLMACTALFAQQAQPHYATLLQQPPEAEKSDPKCLGGPGVRNLQAWIEHAWELGYDTQGANDLRHKLIGTRKWIGTAELYVAFTSRGVPSSLVDFPKPTTNSASTSADRLLTWVVHHFDSGVPRLNNSNNALDSIRGSPVSVSERLPIVLQHKGHSRTIVGYEMNNAGAINLLIYDPAKQPSTVMRRAALAAHYSSSSSPNPHPSNSKPMLSPSRLYEHTKNVFKKRDRAPSPTPTPSSNRDQDLQGVKRMRSYMPSSDHAEGSIQVPPPAENPTCENLVGAGGDLDPLKTANFFRTNLSKLNKNDEYQILYFPLTDPLTQDEKWARRVVRSERIAC